MRPHTGSLFSANTADDLAAELRSVFDAWLISGPPGSKRGGQGLRDDSAEVYRDMWGSFVAFCVPVEPAQGGRRVRINPLANLDTTDLKLFLASAGTGSGAQPRPHTRNGDLSVRYAWRMLHLIDRVLGFAAAHGACAPSTAARDLMLVEPYRYANAADSDPLPEVLTDAQARRLIGFVTTVQSAPTDQAVSWKVVRDHTAVALMLGAGLSPGDVRALLLEGVSVEGGRVTGVPWRLTVPADGTSPEHQAPISDWAGRQLAYWLTVRKQQRMPGNFVFPSTATGKPWAHPSCHCAIVAVLEAAGIPGGTPFRLRHSFGVRQLAKGFEEDQVARWMGYVDTKPMKRYRHLVTRPVNTA